MAWIEAPHEANVYDRVQEGGIGEYEWVGVGVMGWGGVEAGMGQGTDAARVKVNAADDAGVVRAVLVHGQRVRPPAAGWHAEN